MSCPVPQVLMEEPYSRVGDGGGRGGAETRPVAPCVGVPWALLDFYLYFFFCNDSSQVMRFIRAENRISSPSSYPPPPPVQ
ncbi:unnamed protein product [Gadus morhua 'NCC']